MTVSTIRFSGSAATKQLSGPQAEKSNKNPSSSNGSGAIRPNAAQNTRPLSGPDDQARRRRVALAGLSLLSTLLAACAGAPSKPQVGASALNPPAKTEPAPQPAPAAKKAEPEKYELKPLLMLTPTPETAATWHKIKAALAQGKDPLAAATREEKNKLACVDDGVRPALPTYLDSTSMAEYLNARSVRIDVGHPPLVGDAELDDGPVVPAPLADAYSVSPSLGSGWVCQSSADGSTYIGTAKHVVQKALGGKVRLTVTFADGKKYEAQVVSTGSGMDGAYLKVDTKGKVYPTIRFMPDTGKVKRGEYAAALGNAHGFDRAFKEGKWSFIGRKSLSTDFPVHQTTINLLPGDSGSAIVTKDGGLGAITDYIFGDKGVLSFGVDGNAFADLMIASALGLPTDETLLLGINFQPTSYAELKQSVASAKAKLRNLQGALLFAEQSKKQLDGGSQEIPPLYLEKLQTVPGFTEKSPQEQFNAYKEELEIILKQYGSEISKLSEIVPAMEQAYQLGKANIAPGTPDGYVVVELSEDGLAKKAGLPAGAVITRVNGEIPPNGDLLADAIGQKFPWQPLTLDYDFQGKKHTVTLNPDGLKPWAEAFCKLQEKH